MLDALGPRPLGKAPEKGHVALSRGKVNRGRAVELMGAQVVVRHRCIFLHEEAEESGGKLGRPAATGPVKLGWVGSKSTRV